MATTPKHKNERKMPMSKTQASHFPFLKLPPELRNKIYKYALVDPERVISIHSKAGRPYRVLMTRPEFCQMHGCRFTKQLPWEVYRGLDPRQLSPWRVNTDLSPRLLRVCKQIYSEATTVFYAMNHIVFIDSTAMYHFIMRCGRNIQCIRQMTLLQFSGASQRKQTRTFYRLIGAVNLESLTIGEPFMRSFIPNIFTQTNRDTIPRGDWAATKFFSVAEAWLWYIAGKKGGPKNALDLVFFSGGVSKPDKELPQAMPLLKKHESKFKRQFTDKVCASFERRFRSEMQKLLVSSCQRQ